MEELPDLIELAAGITVALLLLVSMLQFEEKHQARYAVAYWVGVAAVAAYEYGIGDAMAASAVVALFGILGALGHHTERMKRPGRRS